MAKVVKKGKKKRKNRKASMRWKKYSEGKANKKFCPRCGAGIFLAQHKNRLFCGRCHYTEFIKS